MKYVNNEKTDKKYNKLKVGSLFAGVGGICQAFKNAGFEVIWANEIDPNACKTYECNHRKTHLFAKSIEDLTKDELQKYGQIDILTAGFPCQPFSLAGHRLGFDDPRGKLFFNFITILKWTQPKAFFLENVKNIMSHNEGKTIEKIRTSIENCGYSFIPFVLKASDYSKIPQARERTYMVGFKGESRKDDEQILTKLFEPPQEVKTIYPFSHFLEEDSVLESDFYTSDSEISQKIRKNVIKPNTFYQYRRYYVRENKSNMCPTLTANMGSGGHNVPIILDKNIPRKLTPKECFNFQGFPRTFKLPNNVNRSQLYKQAGNAVVVPVVESIATQIKKVLEQANDNESSRGGAQYK